MQQDPYTVVKTAVVISETKSYRVMYNYDLLQCDNVAGRTMLRHFGHSDLEVFGKVIVPVSELAAL